MSSAPSSSSTSSDAELEGEGAPLSSLSGWAALSARLARWLPADLARSGQWRGHTYRNVQRLAGRRRLGR